MIYFLSNYKKCHFYPTALKGFGVLFSPMASGWAGGRAVGRLGGRLGGRRGGRAARGDVRLDVRQQAQRVEFEAHGLKDYTKKQT